MVMTTVGVMFFIGIEAMLRAVVFYWIELNDRFSVNEVFSLHMVQSWLLKFRSIVS